MTGVRPAAGFANTLPCASVDEIRSRDLHVNWRSAAGVDDHTEIPVAEQSQRERVAMTPYFRSCPYGQRVESADVEVVRHVEPVVAVVVIEVGGVDTVRRALLGEACVVGSSERFVGTGGVAAARENVYCASSSARSLCVWSPTAGKRCKCRDHRSSCSRFHPTGSIRYCR